MEKKKTKKLVLLACRALAEGDKSRVGARETEREQTFKAGHPDLIFIDSLAAPELGLVITESLTRPAHYVFYTDQKRLF